VIANTLTPETIEKLRARVEAAGWVKTYRATGLSEDTFRRALKGGALSQASLKTLTQLVQKTP
jgi:hypothetical protein